MGVSSKNTNPGPGAYNLHGSSGAPAYSMAQALKKQGVEDSPGPGAYNLATKSSAPQYTMGARFYRWCQGQKSNSQQKGKKPTTSASNESTSGSKSPK
jgi:hypothetical protein